MGSPSEVPKKTRHPDVLRPPVTTQACPVQRASRRDAEVCSRENLLERQHGRRRWQNKPQVRLPPLPQARGRPLMGRAEGQPCSGGRERQRDWEKVPRRREQVSPGYRPLHGQNRGARPHLRVGFPPHNGKGAAAHWAARLEGGVLPRLNQLRWNQTQLIPSFWKTPRANVVQAPSCLEDTQVLKPL